jgi:hypothetical protein
MKPKPSRHGQTIHSAQLNDLLTKAVDKYAKVMEEDDTEESVSLDAVRTAITVLMLRTAAEQGVDVEKLCTDILKARTALDAIETLRELADDGQADKTETEYQSERIMQDLLQRVSK